MFAELTLSGFMKPEIIWMLIGLVMIFLEIIIPGLVTIFFGMGACLVALYCWVGNPTINTQLIVFLAASIIMLLTLRSWFKTIFSGITGDQQNAQSNLSENVGQFAVVVKAIEPNQPGTVDFHGTTWKAQADLPIASNTRVVITRQNNLTLFVKPTDS